MRKNLRAEDEKDRAGGLIEEKIGLIRLKPLV